MKAVDFDIQIMQKFYNGFYLDKPVGNNAFSHSQRDNKRIYVPSIIAADLGALSLSRQIAFSEITGGIEYSFTGLKNFIYTRHQDKDVFIFDNHNHAFFFWAYAVKIGKLNLGSRLVHVDQHRDTREPAKLFKFSKPSDINLKEAFEYTNFELNVGNFIKPALAANVFAQVEIIDSRESFTKSFPKGFVLDIDLDIFSKDMAYIDENYKVERIKHYLESASLVTMATSPFFMDQPQAIAFIKRLLA